MTDPIRPDREMMAYDVIIVGAGPAGLSAAIRLKQINSGLSVCVVEKGAEVGAHLLSGAVLETRALDELIPDWKEKGAPLHVEAKKDSFLFLTKGKATPLPTPPQMKNHGNYIISLGVFARWLAEQAEGLGVEIYPGFAAAEVLYNDAGTVVGIATGDMGLTEDGEKGPNFTPGVELHAKQTIFAEGCRGSLTKHLIQHFDLAKEADPQTYALGIKEIWEVKPEDHQQGKVVHTVGWPLDTSTYGGSFMYHADNNKVYVGFVVGLDYQNPYLSPFEEMQRFKTHPAIAETLKGGRRIAYGARTLVEGGLQSLPRLTFPGGVLAGDCAGFLNVPKIKGNHLAMKTGMLAAEAVAEHLSTGQSGECSLYIKLFEDSWAYKELHKVRNIRPGFNKGLWRGLLNAAIETLTGGRLKRTLTNHADHKQLKKAAECTKIRYPKPDGDLTFDRLSSVYMSNTNHAEHQPSHLKLKKPAVAVAINDKDFAFPEGRYCPAGVYELVETGEEKKLQINAQNCVHCKACDIKDPTQNINWTVPEGGGGPNYTEM